MVRETEAEALREGWDAILVAAGRGERLGLGIPKGRVSLRGEPLFLHSLRILTAHPGFGRCLLVIPPETSEREATQKLLDGANGLPQGARVELVMGGAERQDSVYGALRQMAEEEIPFGRILLIHDAARPLITHALIERCLAAMASTETGDSQGLLPGLSHNAPWGSGPASVIPGLPVRDTLKLVFESRVVLTHARENLYAVQTPQLFRFGPLWQAHQRARESRMRATDDAALLEWQGIPITMVAGETMNRKVTFPDDLEMMERLLASDRDDGPRGGGDGRRPGARA